MGRDLLRVSGRFSSMCLKLQTHLNGSSGERQRAVSVRRIPKMGTTFLGCRTATAPNTHTPPPPLPPPPHPPPLPTSTTSFLISDYIDSTCFEMLNSPYTGNARAITKGQQSSMVHFLNRALSQHALGKDVQDNRLGWKICSSLNLRVISLCFQNYRPGKFSYTLGIRGTCFISGM